MVPRLFLTVKFVDKPLSADTDSGGVELALADALAHSPDGVVRKYLDDSRLN